jgi:hypothetical protein
MNNIRVSDMKIKGLELPNALVQAIQDERWTSRGKSTSGTWMDEEDIKIFRSVFTKCPENPSPQLYGFERLKRENRNWNSSYEDTKFYLGEKDGKYFPGDIDPDRSVIIGSTEPDCPIVLDYRIQENNPSVAYMVYENRNAHWETAADDIDQLIFKLRI